MKHKRGLFGWGIVALCLGLILFGAWTALNLAHDTRTTVTIAGTAVRAQVADTDELRVQGLTGVESLGASDGMLFVFDTEGQQPIWMKGMKIPLDIIWINGFKQVVHVERDVKPASYPRKYRSAKPALYVLEIPAGTAARSGIVPGLTASFDLP